MELFWIGFGNGLTSVSFRLRLRPFCMRSKRNKALSSQIGAGRRSEEEKNCIEAVIQILRDPECASSGKKLLRDLAPHFTQQEYEELELRRIRSDLEAEKAGTPAETEKRRTARTAK